MIQQYHCALTSCAVTGLDPDQDYVFKVVAVDYSNNMSTAATIGKHTTPDTLAPSPAPQLILSGKSKHAVRLIWTPSSDDHAVVYYKVFRTNQVQSPAMTYNIAKTTETYFEDDGTWSYQEKPVTQTPVPTNGETPSPKPTAIPTITPIPTPGPTVAPGNTYQYFVHSYDAAYHSSKSDPLSVNIIDSDPDSLIYVPEIVNVHASEISQDAMTLNWDLTDNSRTPLHYWVYLNGSKIASIDGNSSGTTVKHYQVAGLKAGTIYDYRLIAIYQTNPSTNLPELTSSFSDPYSVSTLSDRSILLFYKPNGWTGTAYVKYHVVKADGTTDPTEHIVSMQPTTSFGSFQKVTILLGSGLGINARFGSSDSNFVDPSRDAPSYFIPEGNQTILSGVLRSGYPDVKPPGVVSDLRVSDQYASTVSLKWTAPTDNVGVIKYEVQRAPGTTNSYSKVNEVTSEQYTDTGLTAGAVYSYRILAYDEYNNVSYGTPYTVTAGNRVVLAYKRGFSEPYVQYMNTDGSWTGPAGKFLQRLDNGVPGESGDITYVGYSGDVFYFGNQSLFTFNFNDNQGHYDNNNGKNHQLSSGIWTYIPKPDNVTKGVFIPALPDDKKPDAPILVDHPYTTSTSVNLIWIGSHDNTGVKSYDVLQGQQVIATVSGEITHYLVTGLNATSTYTFTIRARDEYENIADSVPLTVNLLGHLVTVFYRNTANWPDVYMHYRLDGSTWDLEPGQRMNVSNYEGYRVMTIDLGTTSSIAEAAFTNGSGTWDNNQGKNYSFGVGIYTVSNGIVYSGEPDIVAPSTPGNLKVTGVTSTTVSLSWTASTDNVGVKAYDIYRNGSKIGQSTSASYTDSGLTSGTTYRYAVRATDQQGNVSGLSNEVSITPGTFVTIYYKRGFTTPYIHFRPLGGTWTVSPGRQMDPDSTYSGYNKVMIDTNGIAGLEFVFNNGSNVWDNNQSLNYRVGLGTYTYTPGANNTSPGVIAEGAPDALHAFTIYYKRGFSTPYIHERMTPGGVWSTVPGYPMENSSFAGYSFKTFSLGNYTGLEFVFNNGSNTWDNNNSLNYSKPAGIWTYTPGANNVSTGTFSPGTP